jgi:signal transduction histidine kinase
MNNALNKKIELVNNVSSDLKVYADLDTVGSVLQNLVSNAIKFTYEGGKIILSAVAKNNFAEVSVEDNGVGISEDDFKKLFDIEQNHSTTGTADEMGTGLGLKLCAELVEKNGGDIRAESRLNKGTKFIFTLPLNK